MTEQSGDLTFKQAGIMLLVVAAVVIGADYATKNGHWVWNGIPVIYVGAGFGMLGLVSLIVGIIKKS